jgi:hypothetical protein
MSESNQAGKKAALMKPSCSAIKPYKTILAMLDVTLRDFHYKPNRQQTHFRNEKLSCIEYIFPQKLRLISQKITDKKKAKVQHFDFF